MIIQCEHIVSLINHTMCLVRSMVGILSYNDDLDVINTAEPGPVVHVLRCVGVDIALKSHPNKRRKNNMSCHVYSRLISYAQGRWSPLPSSLPQETPSTEDKAKMRYEHEEKEKNIQNTTRPV